MNIKSLPIKSDISDDTKNNENEIIMYCNTNEIRYPLKFFTSNGNLWHETEETNVKIIEKKEDEKMNIQAHHIGLGNSRPSLPKSVENQTNRLVANFGSITN